MTRPGPGPALAPGRRPRPGALAFLFLVGITLLAPGIGGVVVTAFFPEAAAVHGQVLDGAHPLDALPGIQPRHDQPQWVAMLGGQRHPVQISGQQGVLGREVTDPDVGAVAVVGPDHHVGHRVGGRREAQHLSGGNADPAVVRGGEPGDAVQVGDHLAARQGADLLPVPGLLVSRGRGPADAQVPSLRAEGGHRTVVQHRQLARDVLARRQRAVTVARGPRGLPGGRGPLLAGLLGGWPPVASPVRAGSRLPHLRTTCSFPPASRASCGGGAVAAPQGAAILPPRVLALTRAHP